MSETLPDGWIDTDLCLLLREPLRNGHSARATAGGSGVRTLTLSAVTYGDFSEKNSKLTVAEPAKVSDLWLEPGDLLIERSNTPELVGTARLYKGPPNFAIFPDLVIRARLVREVSPEFVELALHLEESRRYFTENAQGTAGSMPKIDQGVIQRFPLRLPPLTEQRRIVEKVEALLARVNAACERLAKVPAILKRFRQAVLAAACSGRLTEDWREVSGGAVAVDEAWTTCNVESVCEAVVDCPHSTPRWTESGEVCLRTTNFSVRGLDLAEIRFVSQKTYQERVARLEPRAGDVVYSREGGILGIACVIPKGRRTCLGQRMMLMRCKPSTIRPEFLCHVLNSPATLAIVRELTGGTASPHLNVGAIKEFVVRLPALKEQDEILRRVQVLFTLADTVEHRVVVAATRADKLTQAVLAKAFRGELVPTEAELARQEGRDYEPASVLLERIRAERAAAESGREGAKPRRTLGRVKRVRRGKATSSGR